jgi:hypothetical protein
VNFIRTVVRTIPLAYAWWRDRYIAWADDYVARNR